MHTRMDPPSRARAQQPPRPKPSRAEPSPPPSRADDGEAFVHDPHGGPARAPEQLAETLAEEFLQAATSAQEVSEDVRDEIVPEELGGPFLQHTADEEFADGVDEANPKEAERAAFPTALRLDK